MTFRWRDALGTPTGWIMYVLGTLVGYWWWGVYLKFGCGR